MITPQDLDQILFYEANVVSGWCINTILDNWEELQESNISTTLPPDPPHQGKYKDYNFLSVKQIEIMGDRNMIRVGYAGFALTIIPRKIIDIVPFRSDECCVDSCLALDLDYMHIAQYVDLRVKTRHLKRQKSELLVGKKEKEIIYETKTV